MPATYARLAGDFDPCFLSLQHHLIRKLGTIVEPTICGHSNQVLYKSKRNSNRFAVSPESER